MYPPLYYYTKFYIETILYIKMVVLHTDPQCSTFLPPLPSTRDIEMSLTYYIKILYVQLQCYIYKTTAMTNNVNIKPALKQPPLYILQGEELIQ